MLNSLVFYELECCWLGHVTIQTTTDTNLDITPIYESHELEKMTKYLNSGEENKEEKEEETDE